jgi:cell surface protein SprA
MVRPLMALKRTSINYSEESGTQIPGYLQRTRFMGLDTFFRYPSLDFISGLQPSPNVLNTYSNANNISRDFLQNAPFTQRNTKTLNITASLEPITDMKLDLTFMSNYSKNLSENYKYQAPTTAGQAGYFDVQSKILNGSFSVSFIGLNTFFIKPNKDGVSPLFKTFENKRKVISKQLGENNPYSRDTFPGHTDYFKGYGPYAQSVLIPAFLATYAADPKLANTPVDQLFKIIPKPNWRLSYTGLSKFAAIKKYVTTATLSHTYNSTFNIGSFTTSPDFLLALDNNSAIWPIFIDTTGKNFVSYYNVPMISITEQLAPLLGIDITWKNNITSKLDFKMSRNLNMSFVDYQLSEARTTEITIGGGYKRKGANLPFKVNKKKVKLDNDLTFRMDFTFRNDLTINYKLDQNLNTPTRGMKSIGIAPYIDYVVNNKLNIRLFYDYRRTIPATSASFPITAVKAGIKIRFSLAP